MKMSSENFSKLIITLLAWMILLSGCATKEIATSVEASQSPLISTSTPLNVKSAWQTTTNPEITLTEDPSQDQTVIIPTLSVVNTADQPTTSLGTTVSYEMLSFFLPEGVASGASGRDIPGNDSKDAAWWQKTPGHLQVMLGDYYVLKGKSNQPQIYVYPSQAYAELVPAAFESLHRLYNILGAPGSQISTDQLPAVPFFNSQPVFVSNIQVISFQNGAGVRFLTQYAQYPAPINNQDLFYQFQGVTNDGAYYIVAILPITVPFLAENGDATGTLPIGGIDYPSMSNLNPDWDEYYTAATELLNATSPDSFTPAINQLDLLIQSIKIAQ